MTTRTSTLAATAGAAAIAVLAAGTLVATAQAQPLRGSTAAASTAAGSGSGSNHGATARHGAASGPGSAHAYGTGSRSASRARGTSTSSAPLTAEQAADLQAMVEEEKLAGDVYAVLADRYDDAELAAIAASEDRHQAALQTLLVRHGLVDPTAGEAAGEFSSAAVQSLYGDLLARGSSSLEAAYAVGADIERMDIDDLTEALGHATAAADISRVYTNLRTGSQHHLAAFTA